MKLLLSIILAFILLAFGLWAVAAALFFFVSLMVGGGRRS